MTQRFFVNPQQITDSVITITGSDVQHITKVLRLVKGAHVVVADGTGIEYEGCLLDSGQDFVRVSITNQYYSSNESPVAVTLLQGIPKGDKMDLIIQKNTELGVVKFVPVTCRRSIVQLSADKREARQSRWQRIAGEAAKQSKRSQVPIVSPVQTLSEALQALAKEAALLIPWEEEKAQSLKNVLQQLKGKQRAINILIGPEGGLDPEEIGLAREAGGKPVTLGPRILRTETAGLAVVSMILYELGDLGGTLCGTK